MLPAQAGHQLQLMSLKEIYLTKISNDPCSHMVTCHTKFSKVFLRTWEMGTER